MDFKTEIKVEVYLQDKTKFNFLIHRQYQDQVFQIQENILLALLSSATLIAIVPPSQKN